MIAAADDVESIEAQAEGSEVIEDGVCRTGQHPRCVEILDAQQTPATTTTGARQRNHGSKGVADVQQAGGRRRVATDHVGPLSKPSSVVCSMA